MANVTDEDRERLIEEVVSAYRATDPREGLRPSPAFHDLDGEGRAQAFDAAIDARRMEAALDPAGRSTTVRAVLARITRAGSPLTK